MNNEGAQPMKWRTRREPPGPAGYPLIGIIPKISGNPLGFFTSAAQEYGGVVRLDMGPRRMYLVSQPDYVKQVLQDNNRNYAKGYEQVKPLFGDGLLTSEGEFWRRQRRLIQPAFHHQRLASFAATMTDLTAQMLERWQTPSRAGKPIDMAAQMMGLTQRIILNTMFSTDLEGQANNRTLSAISEAFDIALNYFNGAMFSPLGSMDWLPTPSNRRYQRALRFLNETVYGMIADRNANHRDENDLLSMLMNVRDADSGEGMNDRQIRDEIMTIFLAGHETTASALAWTWYLLSQYPDVETQLHEELTTVLGGRTPAVQDLPSLVYTRMVIEESLRIYPPVWMFARRAIADDTIGGYDIAAGSSLMISPYVTHHLPGIWAEPDKFDPQRFRSEHVNERHRFAYMPFSGGPRTCIGNSFAMMEAQLIVAMVAQQFSPRLARGQVVVVHPRATLRPYPTMMMTL